VEQGEAIDLIRGGIAEGSGGTWADLGAGGGTFTLALASLIGPDGVVYAVDRDSASLRGVQRHARPDTAEIRALIGDFTEPLELPGLNGVVIANALHYVPYEHQPAVLAQIATLVEPGGAMVIVEYERRNANRWVPYPIPFEPLRAMVAKAGLGDPKLLATRPSRYSGSIYSALVRFGA
jgi:ubiquinone/menaquinone biosynthesis C-methylase UbiE